MGIVLSNIFYVIEALTVTTSRSGTMENWNIWRGSTEIIYNPPTGRVGVIRIQGRDYLQYIVYFCFNCLIPILKGGRGVRPTTAHLIPPSLRTIENAYKSIFLKSTAIEKEKEFDQQAKQ